MNNAGANSFTVSHTMNASCRYGGKYPELHESFLFKPGNCGSPDKEASPFMTTETPFHQLINALSRRLLITLALSLGKLLDLAAKRVRLDSVSGGLKLEKKVQAVLTRKYKYSMNINF